MEKIVQVINVAKTTAQVIGLAWAGFVIVPHFYAMMRKNTQKVEEGKDAVGNTLMAVAGMYLISEVIAKIVEAVGG